MENSPEATTSAEENPGDDAGIVADLGALPPGAVVTESALAKMFHRHPASIRRAVQRGELPQPAKLLGGPVWTAGGILRHIEGRMQLAAHDREKTERRLQTLRP